MQVEIKENKRKKVNKATNNEQNGQGNGKENNETNGKEKNSETTIVLKYDGRFIDDVFQTKKKWSEKRWLAKVIIDRNMKLNRVFADRVKDKYDISFLAVKEGDMVIFANDIMIRRRFIGRIIQINENEIKLHGHFEYEQI